MSRYPFRKIAGKLLPSSEEAEEALRAVKDGRDVMIEFKAARNVRHHKLLFALLRLVVENHDGFASTDVALTALKIACGHVSPFVDSKTGHVFYVPKSISFSAMSQQDFSAFFDAALKVVVDRWLPAGTSADELRDQIIAIVDGPHAVGRVA